MLPTAIVGTPASLRIRSESGALVHTAVDGLGQRRRFARRDVDQIYTGSGQCLRDLDRVAGLDAIGAAPVLRGEALALATPRRQAAPTRADEPCLWQYSSGSTGQPKGTIHLHGSIAALTELYPRQILDLTADVTFSAAKLFFGYGFGNKLIFPLATGATAILMAERPTPAAVFARLCAHRPTVFYGVPTLHNSMLASPDLPVFEASALRLCTSAGEALPTDLGESWRARFGIDILDGIGSTEMFHIFLSNRPGDVRYGTTGRALDGFELAILDEAGAPVSVGEVGELHIKGSTAASGYGPGARQASRPSLAHGRAAATSSDRMPTGATSIAAARTTC